MIRLGIQNKLKVNRFAPPGAYLVDEEENEVLLPNKYVPREAEEGDMIEVFVYKDSEDRIVATTLTPYVQLNGFAYLQVKEVNNIGAFIDWGLEKDLLIPFRQQKQNMRAGKSFLIYLYLDEMTDRLVATAKVEKHFEKETIDLKEMERVDLLIAEQTDLGFNVVVNNRYRGLVYENEIHRGLRPGDQIKGYVKKIRSDKKIDISLQRTGLENLESGAEKILAKLQDKDGFIALHDKSSPEEIKTLLNMSKKGFKRSVGILYKKKLISIEADGIRLI
jgi:uncharacterized protein